MADKRMEAWLMGPAGDQSHDRELKARRKRVSLRDVAWVMDKLAVTQNAGITVHRALGTLAQMRSGTTLGAHLTQMQSMMGEGASLGQAVRTYEKDFGPLVAALVEAGEASGKLEIALRRAAELTEARARLHRKIIGALIYPMAIVAVTTLIVSALLIAVVPRFQSIYDSVGSDLPAVTKFLVSLSHAAPFGLIVIVALVLAGFMVSRHSKKDPALRERLDSLKMRIPITGPLVRKGVNARIASTISSLLGAGVPILTALQYASTTADNLVYGNALLAVRQRVSDGAQLSAALEQDPNNLFPPLFVQMAAIGEETGAMSDLMDKYAHDAEEEAAGTADALTRIIEPLMIIVIGVIIGFFVVGLYMPIVQLGNQLQ